jgi:hypothetical protein
MIRNGSLLMFRESLKYRTDRATCCTTLSRWRPPPFMPAPRPSMNPPGNFWQNTSVRAGRKTVAIRSQGHVIGKKRGEHASDEEAGHARERLRGTRASVWVWIWKANLTRAHVFTTILRARVIACGRANLTTATRCLWKANLTRADVFTNYAPCVIACGRANLTTADPLPLEGEPDQG